MPPLFEPGMPKWSIPFDLEYCIQMVLKLKGARRQQCHAAVEALEELSRVFASLAFDAKGCRVAQEALAVADLYAMVKLASQLRGHVVEAIESPYANHVVQKVIEVLPPEKASFVVNELIGSGMSVAQHRFGVRIFCRLVEHPCDMVEDLMAEVTQDLAQLCCHKYGSYLVQHFIEYDYLNRGRQALVILVDNPKYFASSWSGCGLISFALPFLNATQRLFLLERFLDDTNALLKLACSSMGQNLVSTLLKLPESGNMRSSLHHAGAALQTSRHGRRVLGELRNLCTNS